MSPICTLLRYPLSDVANAAIKQTNTTDGRRPTASDSHAQNKRPAMPATPNQITRNEASAGPILSTSTRSVVSQRVRPVLPVWVKPVRHDTATLRGYLNSSRHETDWTAGV